MSELISSCSCGVQGPVGKARVPALRAGGDRRPIPSSAEPGPGSSRQTGTLTHGNGRRHGNSTLGIGRAAEEGRGGREPRGTWSGDPAGGRLGAAA